MVVTSSESSDQQSNESITTGVETFSSDGLSRPVTPNERPSTAIVLTVAAALGTDPVKLTPPLHDFVDPDALDRLVDRNEGDYRIEFDAYDCRITVDGTTVSVRTVSPDSPSLADDST